MALDGFETVTIVSAGGAVTAEFVPGANMVCHSLTHRGAELLHTGRGVRAYAEHGKTMGIPLLHPWANRLSGPGYEVAGRQVILPPPEGRYGLDPAELPIHGALPGRLRWQVDEIPAGDRVGARLEWSDPDLLELFPFVHELRLDAWVGDAGLELVTTLRATGEDTVPVSFGHHPYLRPPGQVPRGEWQVSLGASERLLLDDRMIPTGATEPLAETSFRLGDQSWDDGLSNLLPTPAFAVTAGPGTLTLTFDEGFDYAQVYAPAGQDFICFEPMTAPTNALVSGDGLKLVTPGGEHRTAFSVTVTDN
jgi:galactose mutarotase-like enzyme